MVQDIPAFPRTGEGMLSEAQVGMTLRDYFAGQALTVMFALNRDYLARVAQDNSYPINEATARDAYDLADAMIAYRAIRDGQA